MHSCRQFPLPFDSGKMVQVKRIAQLQNTRKDVERGLTGDGICGLKGANLNYAPGEGTTMEDTDDTDE